MTHLKALCLFSGLSCQFPFTGGCASGDDSDGAEEIQDPSAERENTGEMSDLDPDDDEPSEGSMAETDTTSTRANGTSGGGCLELEANCEGRVSACCSGLVCVGQGQVECNPTCQCFQSCTSNADCESECCRTLGSARFCDRIAACL